MAVEAIRTGQPRQERTVVQPSSAGAATATRTGLRAQLALAFAGVAAAPAFCLAMILGHSAYEDALAARRRELSAVSASLDERLSADMARRVTLLQVMAQMENLGRPSTAAQTSALLDNLRRGFPSFAWLGVADPSGRVVSASGGLLLGADVSARPWFSKGRQGLSVGDVHDAVLLARMLPRRDGENWRFVDISLPLHDAAGVLTGVLGAHIDWRWASEVERSIVLPYGTRRGIDMLIVARDGEVLLGPDALSGKALRLPIFFTPPADASAAPASGTAPDAPGRAAAPPDPAAMRAEIAAVQRWPDGRDYLTAVTRSAGSDSYPGLGWSIVARQPAETSWEAGRQVIRVVGFWGLAVALFFGTVGWFLANRIAAPLQRLAAAVNRLRLGEDQAIPPVHGPREVEALSDALRRLLDTLTRKNAALSAAEEAGRRDPLTGLLNRAGLAEQLDGFLLRARLGGQGFTLLCLDLDGFKPVNDRHGHAAGDAVLREVARRLEHCVRGSDAVARVGGDEFVLLLEERPDQGRDGAGHEVGRRVLEALSACPYAISPDGVGAESGKHPGEGASHDPAEGAVRIGCSIGGAVWTRATPDAATLLRHADEALYAAKRAGRGQLLFYRAAAQSAA